MVRGKVMKEFLLINKKMIGLVGHIPAILLSQLIEKDLEYKNASLDVNGFFPYQTIDIENELSISADKQPKAFEILESFNFISIIHRGLQKCKWFKVNREFIDSALKEGNKRKESIQVYTKIYLMVDKANYYTKIGRSKDPIFREKTLQSEKPTIELFREYKGYVEDEKKLHNHFQNKRVRGEWFDLSKEDFNYIDDYFRNKE